MKKFVQKLAFVTTTAFASMSTLAAMPTMSSTAYAADEQSNVYAQVKQALQTDYPVTLPKSVAVQSGKHLTAKTSVSTTGYKVVYYETDRHVAVNDPALDTISKHVVARIQLKHYKSEAAALERVGYENYKQIGGTKLPLGYGLTAYQDAGAGQLYTSWNEGRWALATHAYTSTPDKGQQLAKRAVRYLESHTLPAPQRFGAIRLDAVGSNSTVAWQLKDNVVTIDKAKHMKLLKIATSVR